MGRTTQHRQGDEEYRGIVSIRLSNRDYNRIVDIVLNNSERRNGPRTVSEWIVEACNQKLQREEEEARQRKEGILRDDDGYEDYILPGARHW